MSNIMCKPTDAKSNPKSVIKKLKSYLFDTQYADTTVSVQSNATIPPVKGILYFRALLIHSIFIFFRDIVENIKMPNANAENLLKLTKNTLQNIHKSPLNVVKSVDQFLTYMKIGKIVLTIFILGWVLVISTLIVRKSPSKDSREGYSGEEGILKNVANDDQNYARYYNLHRVWFGDQSTLWLLARIWFYTLIFWMMGPLLKHVAMFAKLKMSI